GQVARALTIGNSGTGGLSWAIAEVSDEDWLNVSPLSGTVAAGSSTGVAVTFTAPLTAGVYNAVLRLTSDDPDEAVVEVPVLLTARSEPAPILTLNPSSLVETLNAGQTATRTLTIGNGGTADLVWSMAETSDVAWLSEAPLSGTLLSGESVNAAVRFDAAGLSAGAHSVQLRLTSNDPGKPVVLVQVTLIVVVEPMPNIIVNPQALTEILNPGGQVVRFVMIVNSGAAGLTWSIAETPEVAWLLVSPLSGTVVAGTDAQVVVTFTAPVTVATYTSVLRITSSDPDQSVLDVPVELEVVSEALVPDIEVTPLSVRVSMPDGNPVQPLRIANVGRAVLTWGPLRESPAVDWLLESKTNGSVPAGGTDSLNLLFDEGVPAGVYTTTLQIFSDDPDEPRVDVQITLLVCEPVSGVSFDYVPLAPSTGQLVTFTARVAAGSSPITYAWNFGDGGTAVANPAYHTFVAGGTYPVVVTVTNVCGGPLTVTHEVMVTGGIFTPTWGVELAPESASANGVQGQQLQYLLTVHNSGNMADTFDLSLAGNAWATSVTPGEVNVSPSGTRQVTVTVTISTTVADGEVDVVTVKAASRGNSSVSDTSTLTTTAVAVVYGVELGAPLDALSGAPGVLVTYTLRLTNTGNMADTFDLSLAGNAWATSVTPGEVNVPPSGTRQITVTVTISTTAADGEVDVVTVKATSRGDPSLSDSSVLTTTALAAAVYGVELGAPLDALSGAPGVSVTYTLRLTNTGNVQDAFTLAAGVSRWVTTLPSELGPLAAGAAADVLAVVQIPSGESAGASDLVTVTAASMGDSSVTSSVQLTTTVARVDYTIYLPVILKSY
ncbi:MAG: PKD domain-containing protein, partial [Thermoflexales bacterium]|nr:PKD domain-containing protein [Thermoflexales bacterium]